MTRSEYLDPVRFPRSTQAGLRLEEQLYLDAHNYDSMREHVARHPQLSAEEQSLWRELQEKHQAAPELLRAADDRGRAQSEE